MDDIGAELLIALRYGPFNATEIVSALWSWAGDPSGSLALLADEIRML
jgi:hypothetical protein